MKQLDKFIADEGSGDVPSVIREEKFKVSIFFNFRFHQIYKIIKIKKL